MTSFAYDIRTPSGQTESGFLEAADATAASAALRADGHLLLRLEERTRPAQSLQLEARISRLPFARPSMATFEVAMRQLSVMLRSGLTLLEALRATAAQSPRFMRATLVDIAERVQEGRTVTQALERHPWMGRMVRQLVEVGEQTGTLDVVLARAADALEKRRLLLAQLISALMYPTLVLVAAIGVTVFILTFAVPRITVYLAALGRPLPPMAQGLVDLSNFLMTSWPMIVGGILLAMICFAVTYAVPVGRLLIDSIALRVPLTGFILRTSATAYFSRSFAYLLASGVTIIEALRTCQELHGNRRLTVLIAEARDRVIGGGALGPALAAPKTFTPMLSSMVVVGEKSGNLDETMTSCAEFHEQRLDALIRTLSSLVEVAVIIVVGGIVGYVYIAFMMALYGAAL
ncbi:MAG: type II secretion system F family protein [Pseudomonadota bacterium]